MVHTEKLHGGPKRVGEILGYLEAAKLFAADILDALRFLTEKGLKTAWQTSRQELKFLFKRLTVLDYIFGNLSLLALLSCFAVFLSGFGLLGYQTVLWLQDGVWNGMPMMRVFEFLFEGTALAAWMLNPESWLGLHQLMEWLLLNTPISLALMVNGLMMSAAVAGGIALAVLVRRFQFKHLGPDKAAE